MGTELIILLSLYVIAITIAFVYYIKRVFPSQQKKGYIKQFWILENKQLIFLIKGKLNIMAIKMTDTQVAKYQLSFVDKKGGQTDAATVELSLLPETAGTISYDDPTNTVTITAGLPGVATIKTVAKNSKGEILPFDDEALEVVGGDAVSGTRSDVVFSEQE